MNPWKRTCEACGEVFSRASLLGRQPRRCRDCARVRDSARSAANHRARRQRKLRAAGVPDEVFCRDCGDQVEGYRRGMTGGVPQRCASCGAERRQAKLHGAQARYRAKRRPRTSCPSCGAAVRFGGNCRACRESLFLPEPAAKRPAAPPPSPLPAARAGNMSRPDPGGETYARRRQRAAMIDALLGTGREEEEDQ